MGARDFRSHMWTVNLPRVVEVVELGRVDEGEVEPRVVVLHLEVEPDEPDPPDGDRRARQDESRRGGQLQRWMKCCHNLFALIALIQKILIAITK